MAKKAGATPSVKLRSNRKKRPGIHSKKKNSKIKNAKNYKKKYRGQGR